MGRYVMRVSTARAVHGGIQNKGIEQPVKPPPARPAGVQKCKSFKFAHFHPIAQKLDKPLCLTMVCFLAGEYTFHNESGKDELHGN